MTSHAPVITDSVDEALDNRTKTLELVLQTGIYILEIGRLLKECQDKRYWHTLGYKNFREYVQLLRLPIQRSYSWAMNMIGIYEMCSHKLAPQKEEVINKIGVSKLKLLIPISKKGLLTEALWEKAMVMNHQELSREVGHRYIYKPANSSKLQFPDIHSDVKSIIDNIGKILGKLTKPEYQVKQYQYDAIWRDAERITHVFEVQVEGNLDSAISKLEYAYYNMGYPNLFLIVAKDEDYSKASQIFTRSEKLEMASSTFIMRPDELFDIYRSMKINEKFFRGILGK